MPRGKKTEPVFVLDLNNGYELWLRQQDYFYLAWKIIQKFPLLEHSGVNLLICSAFYYLTQDGGSADVSEMLRYVSKLKRGR